MDCAECARTVENGVRRLDGVSKVRVDFATSKLVLDGEIETDALRQRLEALGYGLADAAEARTQTAQLAQPNFLRYLLGRSETRLALIGGAVILAGVLLSLLGLPDGLTRAVFIIATLIALYPIARSGLNNLLINHDFNINLLMTIAAVGAILIDETLEAATVIFLFAIGEALEGYTADRARNSIRSLMSLAPARALRLRDGREEEVAVEQLAVGDQILVRPGDRIPMDGRVTSGESSVDQAPVTGESVPVHKTAGDVVYAGTINGAGALELRVTHRSDDNTIQRIIRMVEEAQGSRAPSQRLIDQFARIYTPAVVVIAAVVAIVPPLLFNAPFYDLADGTHGWLYRALSLLVIACPCALVISTPVTVISAITAAARRGVLIKGGAHLEALGRLRALAFDKTGTLTHGKPVVTALRASDCPDGAPCAQCDDVLALAAAVERRSAHPLARAVVDAAQARGLDAVYAPAEAVESLAGMGVRGRVDGRMVTIGSHDLFDSQHPHSNALCAQAHDAEARGQTTMMVSDGERVRGYLAVADEVRDESADVISELRALGLTTIMLTGDHAVVGQAVGDRTGVDQVRAGLLPADKVDAVRQLLDAYQQVGMVGDGINDTPALATATVGVAMGGAGSAQALETADVALMADDLRQLPFAVRLSRFARQIIKQNVIISFGIKLLFVVLALFGVTSLWAAVAADMGTSLLVTLNGTRPVRFEQTRKS
jgi:Cd2+/Zn2+-exporting ATPase